MPENLKSFLIRSYEKCSGKKEEEIMTSKLKDIVITAKAAGEMNSIDWTKFPIPNLPREKKNNSILKIERVERSSFDNDSNNKYVSFIAILNKKGEYQCLHTKTKKIRKHTC